MVEYDTKVDSKKRVTLRGAKTEYYHVEEKQDGTIILSPRVLVHPDTISENTLSMMDKSMQNISYGIDADPLNEDEIDGLIE